MNEPPASPPRPPPGPPASSAASNPPKWEATWHGLPWAPIIAPSTQAIIALVLGVLGVVCFPPVAPVAWYLGSKEEAIRQRRAAAAPPGPPSRPRGPFTGGGLGMYGKILGIIGTFMLVLELLFGLLCMLFFGGMTVLQGISNR